MPHSQVISEQQGQELADELGLRFLETSAKSNINVEQAFFALARCVLRRVHVADASGSMKPAARLLAVLLTDVATTHLRSDIKARLIDTAAPSGGSGAGGAAGSSSVGLGQGQGNGEAKSGCC